ncbi:MAG: hypothetical protein JXQ89_09180 [Pelagimonas sp.]
MSLFRPEATAEIARWSEALVGAGVLALGLYWSFFTGGGLLHWIGYGVAAIGAAFVFSGVRRARFGLSGEGLGFVQVTEREISYFTPDGGGAVSVDNLMRVSIEVLGPEQVRWIFVSDEGSLAIPYDASGTEALFDVLSALPGAQFETAIQVLAGSETHSSVIWRRETVR